MRKRLTIMGLVLWAFSLAALAAEPLKCDICGQPIAGNYYTVPDQALGGTKNVCTNCAKIEDRCFYCGLPIKGDSQILPDGRILCARDSKLAVQTEDEAKRICEDTRADLDHLLARFISFPATNVVLSIVNRFYLENLFHSPSEGQACVSVYGATSSNPMPGHRMVHAVAVLSHLPEERLRAVCAHEFTHAWMGENVSHERLMAIEKNTVEGFCELVAYKYMESRQDTNQMGIIERNNYTKGKIDVLIAADKQYGFNAVVDWIKSGDDATLEINNLARIRAVDGTYVPAQQPAPMALLSMPAAAPTPVPNTLMLKGISGSGQHRFALINNATLEPMERGRVRVGQTNVMVQCLEIHDQSVTIQIEGSNEKKQLFLRNAD
jgi:hypothetical protein